MNKHEILVTLREQKNYLTKTFEVERIGVFGSYANDSQQENSDIDIYVEFSHKTYDNVAGLWNYLESIYHKKIDLVYKHKSFKGAMFDKIQKEVIYG